VPDVDFRILGPLEVRIDDRVVPITGAKQRAILALLLLHVGEVVSIDRLIDELWGDEPPEAGATALRVRVSQLRKSLAEAGDALVTRPAGYLLQIRREQLDLRRFERLVATADRAFEDGAPAAAVSALDQALALWRGPPLSDLAYEPFVQAPVVRLEELRLAALELRNEAKLALGRHSRLVAELRALVREHPLRERLAAQLMLALYRDGRQAEALDVYQAARRRLVEEVGIEPGPELRDLERRVLAQDPELAAAPRGGARSPAEPARLRAVLVAGDEDPRPLAALARPLAAHGSHELIVIALVGDAGAVGRALANVEALRQDLGAQAIPARVAAFTTPARGRDVNELATEQDAAVLLLEVGAGVMASGDLDGELTTVLTGAVCDVGLVAGCERAARTGGPVLVPFAGGDHDWAAVELGAWLAKAGGVPLRLVGARGDSESGRRDASRLLGHASLALQRGVGIAAEPLLAPPGPAGILGAAPGASIVVAGLSDRWPREGLGPARLELARGAPTPVVLVRRGVRPGGLAPARALTRFTWSAG
jgi:DNA-binding SARP family transcriptional activator